MPFGLGVLRFEGRGGGGGKVDLYNFGKLGGGDLAGLVC